MSHALLTYQPKTACLLRWVLEYEKKEEFKRRHLGDISCLIFQAIAPKCRITMYSEYAHMLEENHAQQDIRNGEEILQDMVDKLKRRKKNREAR